MTYYLGLDGLRAVAVLLVLLFHAQLSFVPGGSIGVDVFFCISGYIITAQIYRLIERREFRLGGFWSRRIARLFPAVLATAAITMLVFSFVMPASALARLYEVAIYCALSISNFYFLAEAGYFDAASQSKPLLHTWSLGVEAQFYLVWPLVLIAAYRAGGRSLAIATVGLCGIASLVAAIAAYPAHPSEVFYMMPFRIFQFALGALIALLGWQALGTGGSVFAILGLAGLVLNASLVDTATAGFFPAHVLPALFSAMIILAIQSQFSRQVLGSGILVSIGKASYSIYLAHWPLMVFYFYTVSAQVTLQAAGLLIAASMVLGYALHYTVEKPLRFNRTTTPQRKSRTLAGVSLAGLALIGVAAWSSPSAPTRQSVAAQAQDRARYGICTFFRKAKPEKDVTNFDPATCLRIAEGKTNILVLGNSISDGIYVGLLETLPSEQFAVSQAGYAGCTPAQMNRGAQFGECDEFDELRMRLALEDRHDLVVLASQWKRYGSTQKLRTFIQSLRERGKQVLVLTGSPTFSRSAFEIAEESLASGKVEADLYRYIEKPAAELSDGEKVRKAAESSGAHVLDIQPLLCREGACPGLTSQNRFMYYDNRHLTVEGAKYLGGALRPVIENILAQRTTG